MKYSSTKEAIRLARAFLEAAFKLEQISYDGQKFDGVNAGKDSGAARRASMDLTRALAEMRKT